MTVFCGGHTQRVFLVFNFWIDEQKSNIRLVAEKWYDTADQLIAHYKYVYDGNGNIVRSIDFGAEKEYTYTYENGVLVRAAEYDITFNDSEIVTGKVLADSVHYVYDQNGKLAKKRIAL